MKTINLYIPVAEAIEKINLIPALLDISGINLIYSPTSLPTNLFTPKHTKKASGSIAINAFISSLIGALIGFLLQFYLATKAYPANIGGKPVFALPSYLPIIFECAIFFGVCGLAASLILKKKKPDIVYSADSSHLVFNLDSKIYFSVEDLLTKLNVTPYAFEKI